MSTTKINVIGVKNKNSYVDSANNTIISVRCGVTNLRYRIDGEIRDRRNIDGRLVDVNRKLNSIYASLSNIKKVVNQGADEYKRTDDRVYRMGREISAKYANLTGGSNGSFISENTYSKVIHDKNLSQFNNLDRSNTRTQGKTERKDFGSDKQSLWGMLSGAGVIGSATASFGAMITGKGSGETLLNGFKNYMDMFGDLAADSCKSGSEFSTKKTFFGDWSDVRTTITDGATITSPSTAFVTTIKEELKGFSFGKATTVGDKIKVATKWGGVLVDTGLNAYNNFTDSSNSTGRAVAETVTETVVDIGINIVAKAAVTAGAVAITAATGIAIPAVAVGAAAVGVVWLADATTKFFNKESKGLTELVSDTVIDAAEGAGKAIGSAAKAVGGTITKWADSIFG